MMTMMAVPHARARAGLLLAALALVGGIGCASFDPDGKHPPGRSAGELERARQRRIVQLTPLARNGDPAAMTALAYALLAAPVAADAERAQALAYLERAAGRGDAQAQALLGDWLASGRFYNHRFARLPQGAQDPARGIALLQRAATQACRISALGDGLASDYMFARVEFIEPALRASVHLAFGQAWTDALVWRARSVAHCGAPGSGDLAMQAASAAQAPQQRVEALALLLLAGDRARFEKARAGMAQDDVAAAERMAAALPQLIAQSEREYPAPARKELR